MTTTRMLLTTLQFKSHSSAEVAVCTLTYAEPAVVDVLTTASGAEIEVIGIVGTRANLLGRCPEADYERELVFGRRGSNG